MDIYDDEHMQVDMSSSAYNLDKEHFPEPSLCVIINNKNFVYHNERRGTDVDADTLCRCFTVLGFQVEVKCDQTHKQMIDLLRDVSKQDHSKRACFVCILLSHGDNGKINGTDGEIEIQYLSGMFCGMQCPSLSRKPKLFFIQACQGTMFDDGVEVDSILETDSLTQCVIPVEADFLYCHSTVPGYYSWRNMECGSWFVQSLTQVLSSSAINMELIKLLTRVNFKVANFESATRSEGTNKKKQVSCIMSKLTKEFFFKHLKELE
uniref:caspase-3-like isoform X1 n=1 Tax=Myxine glutinosa TaxID=7769 RepID=UPI0035900153